MLWELSRVEMVDLTFLNVSLNFTTIAIEK